MTPVWPRTIRAFSAAAVFAGLPSIAHAQQSASITLRGFVPEVSSLQVLEVNAVVSQDLRSSISDRLVARFAEQSNSLSGYTITISSESAKRQHLAGLVNKIDGTVVPYSLTYGGTKLQFVNGEAVLNRSARRAGERRQENELKMSTTGTERLQKGEYTDTITLMISAR